MKVIRKLDVFIVFLFVIVIGLYVAWYLWKAIPAAYRYDSRAIQNCLLYFVNENSGKFPVSEQNLIDEGYLEIKDSIVYLNFPDSYKYDGGSNEPRWHRCLLFKSFLVRYGTKVDELRATNKILCDKVTNKQTFLIYGPYDFFVPYKEYSNELFQKMLVKSVTN